MHDLSGQAYFCAKCRKYTGYALRLFFVTLSAEINMIVLDPDEFYASIVLHIAENRNDLNELQRSVGIWLL